MLRLTAEAVGPEQLALFDMGVDMAKLRERRAGLVRVQRSLNTRVGYACDWRRFSAWCASTGRDALPASADTVSLYLTYELERGLRVATLARKAAAIAWYHRQAGHEVPRTGDVPAMMGGARRERRERPAGKAALTVEHLVEIERGMRGSDAATIRNRAILLFGFASALRRSELAALDLSDVSVTREGIAVLLRRSKTDQEGRGRELGIPPASRERALCPVAALRAWLRVRGRRRGPLFCAVSKIGRPLLDRRLGTPVYSDVVQRAVASIGLDPTAYGAHSLRVGVVTAAVAAGASPIEVMKRTGHRKFEMIERYCRPSLFASDPLAKAI
jgi:site-specific recombinase XerD